MLKNCVGFLAVALCITGCSNGTSFGIGAEEAKYDSTIKYNNKVDIIWVVDDSSSMLPHQQKLANEVSDMITKLNELKMDYRMVVTTTSVGTGYAGGTYTGNPKVLTKATADLVNLLKSRLIPGERGSNLEVGIQSLQNLLADSYVNDAGQGFHREESLLLINVLSDENDQTAGSSASVVQSLKSRLDQFKKPFRPNVGGWIMNFIGVTDPECNRENSFGQDMVGHRYMDLASSSGGKSFSICNTSLKDAVASLQARVLEIITDYPLASVPNLDTVRVYMNGVLVPRSSVNGWNYIPELRVIRFFGTAVPSSDVTVKVDYTPAGAS